MIHQALIDVVKNQLNGGVSKEEVMEFLHRRGTDDTEIRAIFEALSPDAPAIQDIPVASSLPAQSPVADPVSVVSPEQISAQPIPIPATSEAHGVVRSIPPLQPSAPFSVISGAQVAVPSTVNSVAASSASAAVFVENQSAARGTKKKAFVIVATVGALVAFLTGGWFAYGIYFGSPEQNLARMVSNLKQVKSAVFSGEVIIVMQDLGYNATTSQTTDVFAQLLASQGSTTIATAFTASFDGTDESSPKLALAASSTIQRQTMDDVTLSILYKNISRINYLFVEAIPDLGFLKLGFLKNRWFMASDADTRAQFGQVNKPSQAIVPSLTQEQRNELFLAWKEFQFLNIHTVFGAEIVEGISTNHYALAFNKDIFMQWIGRAQEIIGTGDASAIDTLASLVTIEHLEIWIGKRDGLPHKLQMKAITKDARNPDKVSEITLSLVGSTFNEALDISAPVDSESIEEAVKGVFGQMIGDGMQIAAPKTAKERNARRKSDIALIADAIVAAINKHGGTFSCAAGPLPTKALFIGLSGYALEPCLVPWHLRELPKDPSKGTATMSGYSLFYDNRINTITVRAPYAELGEKISITK